MENLIFSETEKKILNILGWKMMTISELTEKHYKNKKKPLNPNNVIAGTVRRINKKCKYHKLNWFINGEGLGRGGKEVWKDEKLKTNIDFHIEVLKNEQKEEPMAKKKASKKMSKKASKKC